jgi:hypothetical protein
VRFYDPTGNRYGIPTYPFHLAPDGLATRRQLRARALRPAGQPVAAQLMWFSRLGEGPRVAYLYRIDLARPVRAMTPAKATALAAAMLARRTCPACRADAGYVIPTSLGCCVPCSEPQARAA